MKLMNGVIRPGIVLETFKNGDIKASAPGLFSDQDKANDLPPIKPFFKAHCNEYSEPTKLNEVWILNFDDNPLQLYWFRKDDFETDNKNILNEEATNVEVLCNRESGMGWASIYFSDGSGWMIKNDDSFIQIDKEGNITLSNNLPHRTIKINEDGIHLGCGGEHPAVHGDTLLDVLTKIVGSLELIQQAAKSTPFTSPIAAALLKPVTSLKAELPSFLSDHVKLD